MPMSTHPAPLEVMPSIAAWVRLSLLGRMSRPMTSRLLDAWPRS